MANLTERDIRIKLIIIHVLYNYNVRPPHARAVVLRKKNLINIFLIMDSTRVCKQAQ